MKQFDQFMKQLENYNLTIDDSGLTEQEKEYIGGVYESVKDFLTENQLVPGELLPALESIDTPVTTLVNEVSLNDIGIDPLIDLCKKAKVPDYKLRDAVALLGLTISKYTKGEIKNSHFDKSISIENFSSDVQFKTLENMYSSAALSENTMTVESSWKLATESFGITMDNTYLDAKTALTVTLLQFQKSILNRLLPIRPVDGEVVTYKVDRVEIYDIAKASAATAAERYKGSHRIPFINLYNDPTSADTTPKQIIPLTSNDSGGDYLIADGIVKLNVEANLFDLSILPNVLGMDKVDYTDLVSEGGKIASIIINVTDTSQTPAVTETIEIPVSYLNGAKFTYPTNAAESSERINNIEGKAALDDSTLTIAGTAATTLAFLNDDNHYVEVGFTLNGKIDLRTSYIKETGSIATKLATKDGTTPLEAMETAYSNLTFELVGYKPEVYFSPENLRRISAAARLMTGIVAYPIPGSKTVAVDYSVMQTSPEAVINTLTEYLTIGNDTRGVKLILDNINYVKARLEQEASYPLAETYTEKLMHEFVAGYKVRPSVFVSSVNISSNVTNMRSGDIWGDIRTLFEKYLVEIITYLMNTSYYYVQLNPGEKVTFNVLTSGYIKDALLSVPFYHTAFDNGTQVNPDDIVEFRRVLPNGAVLNVITSNFNYLSDKVIMVPIRPNNPQSEVNYAHLVDKGNFVSTLTAYSGTSSAFKRIVANSRQIPIITCPVAALITVQNLTEVFNGIGVLGNP